LKIHLIPNPFSKNHLIPLPLLLKEKGRKTQNTNVLVPLLKERDLG
jgi:hypothetical protein